MSEQQRANKMKQKLQQKYQSKQFDLFDNHMVREAKKNMTPEQIEEYKQIGEQMYNTVDFETGQAYDQDLDSILARNVYEIDSALRSGLGIENLEENDIKILQEVYGKNWKDKYV